VGFYLFQKRSSLNFLFLPSGFVCFTSNSPLFPKPFFVTPVSYLALQPFPYGKGCKASTADVPLCPHPLCPHPLCPHPLCPHPLCPLPLPTPKGTKGVGTEGVGRGTKGEGLLRLCFATKRKGE
jgi:hypothetical protein